MFRPAARLRHNVNAGKAEIDGWQAGPQGASIGDFARREGVGGIGIHWGALHWRFFSDRFPHSQHAVGEIWRQSSPANPGLSLLSGWPWRELELHYDRFDKLCGVSGQAGNLPGQPIAGGNPFEGPRANHYPNKPIKTATGPQMFASAAKSLGYHPFPAPTATSSLLT